MTDADVFLETVRETNQTALSRLGSSKSLYADTGGDIDTEPVLEATADAEYAAWQTFSAWADDEDTDAASEAFADTAAEEEGHFETVCEHLGNEAYEPQSVPALHEYLRGSSRPSSASARSRGACSRASARKNRSSATSSATPIPRPPASSATLATI